MSLVARCYNAFDCKKYWSRPIFGQRDSISSKTAKNCPLTAKLKRKLGSALAQTTHNNARFCVASATVITGRRIALPAYRVYYFKGAFIEHHIVNCRLLLQKIPHFDSFSV